MKIIITIGLSNKSFVSKWTYRGLVKKAATAPAPAPASPCRISFFWLAKKVNWYIFANVLELALLRGGATVSWAVDCFSSSAIYDLAKYHKAGVLLLDIRNEIFRNVQSFSKL
jgi:hypothetical protein